MQYFRNGFISVRSSNTRQLKSAIRYFGRYGKKHSSEPLTGIMTEFRKVTCVLFDMDGLLLDTENLYSEGTQKALSEYGHTFDWEFKAQLMGKRTDEVAKMMVEHYKLPISPEEWVVKSRTIYDEMFPSVKTLPGVIKLVHHLARNQVSMAVATSSSKHSFLLKTRNHSGLFSLFDSIVLGDDPRVTEAKPAPDIFLVAAEELKEQPKDCLVFEDAPLGVKAGTAAGMQVVMVPHPKLAVENTREATLRLGNLHLLRPEVFGLPGYSYSPVTHVIFDMDGLLLNTQDMYSSVGAQFLAEYGKVPDWDFKMKVIGRKAEEVAEMAVQHYGLPFTGSEYLALFQEKLHSLFPTCSTLQGVERLVDHLVEHNIPIAVATSSSREVMELKTGTKHQRLFSKFSHIVTGCDSRLKQAKPSPEIYQLAASLFDPPAQTGSCLVFEDAPNGVQSGLDAGMQVVMIPHHKVTKNHLLPATQVLSSMSDFKPEDFGLPPFMEI